MIAHILFIFLVIGTLVFSVAMGTLIRKTRAYKNIANKLLKAIGRNNND